MNTFIKGGLLIFAIFMIVNYTVYKFSKTPTIVILCMAAALILYGAFRR